MLIHVWCVREFPKAFGSSGAGWTLGAEGQFLYARLLRSDQSRKAMTSVLTSSKIAMNLPLLLLILTTFQVKALNPLNKTLIRSKRYATHLNPIYRHFDFLKRDGNYKTNL